MESAIDQNAKLFVKTASADGIIDPYQEVYVKLVDGYVKKSAEDLQPGDLVVVRKDCINKTIQDVLPVIREGSMMYRLAEDRLYRSQKILDNTERITTQDLRKPLLSVLLLEGLTRNSTEPRKTLENKIYGVNDPDFSPEEYTAFANQVHTVLRNGLIARSKSLDHLVSTDTIRAWLKGETLAPKYWENLECLSEINPEFEAELHEEKAGFNLRSAYDFAMQARRVVMDRLLHATTTTGPLNGDGLDGHKKYSLETRLAVAQLIDSVGPTTIASRITNIGPEQRTKEKRDPKMERAIYTGPLDVPFIPMNDVRDTSYLLNEALYGILDKYALLRALEKANSVLKEEGLDVSSFQDKDSLLKAIETRFTEKGFGITLGQKDRETPLNILKDLITLRVMIEHHDHSPILRRANTYFSTVGEFFERLVRVCPKESYINGKNREILLKSGQSPGKIQTTIDRMYKEFNATMTEQPDDFKRATAISPNEFYTLVDLANRYRSALPKRYLQNEANNTETSIEYCVLLELQRKREKREDRRDTRKKLEWGLKRRDKLGEQLRREYGIEEQNKHLFLSSLVDPKKGVSTHEDQWRIRLHSLQELRRKREEREVEDNLVFYKRDEVTKILDTLGIPGIIKAYDPRNFLELFVDLTPRSSFERYLDRRIP